MSLLARPKKKRMTTRQVLPKLVFEGAPPVVQFYSNSRKASPKEKEANRPLAALEKELADIPDWRQYLSNFTFVPPPGSIPYGDKRYPSVEHAFAAAKYKYSTNSQGDVPPDFSVGSELGRETDIKAEHSRKGMKKYNFVMNDDDLKRFDQVKYDIMKQLVRSRSRADPTFIRILRAVRKHGFKLLHFARGGGGGWGGYVRSDGGGPVGFNWLGQIMNELAEELTQAAGAGAGGAGASKSEELLRF